MEPTTVTLTVVVNIDPIPGAFHEPESIQEYLKYMLDTLVPHYEPKVTISE